MALTQLQHDVCRLLSQRRRLSGESYVAGGLALNEVLKQARRSRDVDVFHDTQEALVRAWEGDRTLLVQSGFTVEVIRERPSFVEATIRRGQEAVAMEWSQDSAYRFFPLVEHPLLGLTMHPLDLATNKVLALAGRREPRDLIDALACDAELQPLGYLAWAASGKDPGLGPALILSEAASRARYTQQELEGLDFGDGAVPDAASLMSNWHARLREARLVVEALPAEAAGCCVLEGLDLARRPASELSRAVDERRLTFHPGRLGGAFPRML